METALAIAQAQYEERTRRDRLDLVLRSTWSDWRGGGGYAGAHHDDESGRGAHRRRGRIPAVGAAPPAEAAAGLTPGPVLARGTPELGRVEDVRGQALVVDAVPCTKPACRPAPC